MKLILITAIEYFQKDVKKILKQAEIEHFSGVEVEGFNTHPSDSFSWFSSREEGIESHMYFSFTTAEKAQKVLDLAKAFNETLTKQQSRIRAIVMPIEAHT